MEKTLFIVFEGIDGCGKDTQLHKLIGLVKEDDEYPFGNKYSNIWVTREPTKITKSGEKISQLIRERDVSGEEATKLYVEDRIEHTKLIKEILKHSHVFSSRYDILTLSYQMTQGMDFDYMYELHKYGKNEGAIIPDITILFDLPVEVALKRMSLRKSQEECFEKEEFQRKLKGNLDFCIDELRKRDKRKIIVVNANQEIEKVTKEMCEKIKDVLEK